MKTIAIISTLAIAGCGGSDFTDCKLGALSGSWRIHYAQVDGTCGAIPDETVLFQPGMVATGCGGSPPQISADLCDADVGFTCPLTGGGTQTWVIHLEQTGEDRIEGSGTVDATDGVNSCRSTYDMTIVRL